MSSIFLIVVLRVYSPSVALFCSPSFTITGLGTVTSTRRNGKEHHAPLLYIVHRGKSSTKQLRFRQGHHILHLAPQQLGEFKELSLANGGVEGREITRNLRRVWLYDFVALTGQHSSPEARTFHITRHGAYKRNWLNINWNELVKYPKILRCTVSLCQTAIRVDHSHWGVIL